MKTMKLVISLITLFIGATLSEASIPEDRYLGGTIKTDAFGKLVDFPSLSTDIKADIQGDSTTVSVTQTFINPTNKAVNAKYLFPLNKDSAIHSMVMEMGDEIVEAQIKEKKKAKEIYDDAKKEGRAASLLEQHRPNMFTQNIANLPPGLPIKVTIKYVQQINKIDNDYELVIPLIVGPRYEPKQKQVQTVGLTGEENDRRFRNEDTGEYGKWSISKLPEYPSLIKEIAPSTIEPKRVSISMTIKSSTPIGSVYSKTHKIETSGGQFQKTIALSKKSIIDNSDFILRFNLGGSTIQSGFMTHKTSKGNYFSLMVEPPKDVEDKNIMGRELVFVIDTSGSQDGAPLEASKIFMRHALKKLRSQDIFRIINFGSSSSEFSFWSKSATRRNINNALDYVDALQANGGTEIIPALRKVFDKEQPKNMLQLIVFLSDGYVGNESEIFKFINKNMHSNSRLFSFGVGSSVNRFLLHEMAYMGRGFFRVIDPTQNPDEFAKQFANKIKTPLLTNIKVDWGNLEVSEVTPKLIPDLFAGDSIRIYGKYKGEGINNIKINGIAKGKEATLLVKANLYSHFVKDSNGSIPLIWARSKISDYMRLKNTPKEMRHTNISDDELKEKVTNLGLKHSLITKWTSFVAVSRKVVNPNPENNRNSQVPLPKVKGVTYNAYGNILAQNFSGYSVPEPQHVFALTAILLQLVLASIWLARKKRAIGSIKRGSL